MEKPRLDLEPQTCPEVLSSSNSGRRRSTDPNTPEFEFWMVRNPSFPTPHLSSADELFNNGVLLPLDHLTHQPDPPDSADPAGSNNKSTDLETTNTTESNPEPISEPGPGPESSSGFSASKRWRDIFKLGLEKKSVRDSEDCKERNNKEKEKKKDRKSGVGSGVGGSISGGATELNINIWPFSRSHSAGNGTNRPRLGSGSVSRKVSSAPCSRSNSAGESKSRKWPNSPGRGGGIHLGRNSPVWQVRRSGSGLRSYEPPAVVAVRVPDKGLRKEGVKNKSSGGNSGVRSEGSGGGGTKTRGLNLNVPMCIGYRQQLSCRSDESSFVVGSGGGGGGEDSGNGGAGNIDGGSKLFNLRTLFTRKVY